MVNIFLYIILGIVLLAAFGSVILKQPFIMSAVRSNSMYPLFEKGDIIFIKRLSVTQNPQIGDIVIFNHEQNLDSKDWVVHRIIDGNIKDGFITKGDANKYSDQEIGIIPPIKREWIYSKVITLKGKPIKLPLLGYLPLITEKYIDNPILLPTLVVILAIILGANELMSGSKRKKKKSIGKLDYAMLYFFSGLTISIMLGATMLISSDYIKVTYEVSENSQGAIMGSKIGIINVGETVEKPLSELTNKGFLPIIATITTDDAQISFDTTKLKLNPKTNIQTSMKIQAQTPGMYESTIWVGMFYPLLPESVIYGLAKKNYWYALIVISLIPGIPIMIYPLIDNEMRRKMLRELKKLSRKCGKLVSRYI